VTTSRKLQAVIESVAASDGAGVKLRRSLGSRQNLRFDPFLMLDEFFSDNPDDYLAGFPSHPHRGFETVTYMLDGRMRHRDSAGHEGLLQGGGVQWMTAGRGVIHSEMPEQDAGRMEGFQLWLNLPAQDKMCAPWYRDIPAEAIPKLKTPDGVVVHVIAGASQGAAGAMQRQATQPLYLDLHFPAGASFEQAMPAAHNAFVYVYRGELDVEGRAVKRQRMAIFANTPGSDGVALRAGAEGARAILIAGQPLGEPIAQHGPFVMNNHEQIIQAVEDYRAGRLA